MVRHLNKPKQGFHTDWSSDQAFKTAAHLPLPVYSGRGSGRSAYAPRPGELPDIVLRVQIVSCIDLLAKDKGGVSDPFIIVTVLRDRFCTSALKKTVNPVWSPQDATFDFQLYHSLADKLGVVEFVIRDGDFIFKGYLGKVSIPLDDWLKNDSPFSSENLPA